MNSHTLIERWHQAKTYPAELTPRLLPCITQNPGRLAQNKTPEINLRGLFYPVIQIGSVLSHVLDPVVHVSQTRIGPSAIGTNTQIDGIGTTPAEAILVCVRWAIQIVIHQEPVTLASLAIGIIVRKINLVALMRRKVRFSLNSIKASPPG